MKQLLFGLFCASMVMATSSDVDSKAVSSVTTASTSNHITTQKMYITNTNCRQRCDEEGSVKLVENVPYQVTVKVAQIDMYAKNEKLTEVTIGGKNFGDCNPKPEGGDRDCTYHDCFASVSTAVARRAQSFDSWWDTDFVETGTIDTPTTTGSTADTTSGSGSTVNSEGYWDASGTWIDTSCRDEYGISVECRCISGGMNYYDANNDLVECCTDMTMTNAVECACTGSISGYFHPTYGWNSCSGSTPQTECRNPVGEVVSCTDCYYDDTTVECDCTVAHENSMTGYEDPREGVWVDCPTITDPTTDNSQCYDSAGILVDNCVHQNIGHYCDDSTGVMMQYQCATTATDGRCFDSTGTIWIRDCEYSGASGYCDRDGSYHECASSTIDHRCYDASGTNWIGSCNAASEHNVYGYCDSDGIYHDCCYNDMGISFTSSSCDDPEVGGWCEWGVASTTWQEYFYHECHRCQNPTGVWINNFDCEGTTGTPVTATTAATMLANPLDVRGYCTQTSTTSAYVWQACPTIVVCGYYQSGTWIEVWNTEDDCETSGVDGYCDSAGTYQECYGCHDPSGEWITTGITDCSADSTVSGYCIDRTYHECRISCEEEQADGTTLWTNDYASECPHSSVTAYCDSDGVFHHCFGCYDPASTYVTNVESDCSIASVTGYCNSALEYSECHRCFDGTNYISHEQSDCFSGTSVTGYCDSASNYYPCPDSRCGEVSTAGVWMPYTASDCARSDVTGYCDSTGGTFYSCPDSRCVNYDTTTTSGVPWTWYTSSDCGTSGVSGFCDASTNVYQECQDLRCGHYQAGNSWHQYAAADCGSTGVSGYCDAAGQYHQCFGCFTPTDSIYLGAYITHGESSCLTSGVTGYCHANLDYRDCPDLNDMCGRYVSGVWSEYIAADCADTTSGAGGFCDESSGTNVFHACQCGYLQADNTWHTYTSSDCGTTAVSGFCNSDGQLTRCFGCWEPNASGTSNWITNVQSGCATAGTTGYCDSNSNYQQCPNSQCVAYAPDGTWRHYTSADCGTSGVTGFCDATTQTLTFHECQDSQCGYYQADGTWYMNAATDCGTGGVTSYCDSAGNSVQCFGCYQGSTFITHGQSACATAGTVGYCDSASNYQQCPNSQCVSYNTDGSWYHYTPMDCATSGVAGFCDTSTNTFQACEDLRCGRYDATDWSWHLYTPEECGSGAIGFCTIGASSNTNVFHSCQCGQTIADGTWHEFTKEECMAPTPVDGYCDDSGTYQQCQSCGYYLDYPTMENWHRYDVSECATGTIPGFCDATGTFSRCEDLCTTTSVYGSYTSQNCAAGAIGFCHLGNFHMCRDTRCGFYYLDVMFQEYQPNHCTTDGIAGYCNSVGTYLECNDPQCGRYSSNEWYPYLATDCGVASGVEGYCSSDGTSYRPCETSCGHHVNGEWIAYQEDDCRVQDSGVVTYCDAAGVEHKCLPWWVYVQQELEEQAEQNVPAPTPIAIEPAPTPAPTPVVVYEDVKNCADDATLGCAGVYLPANRHEDIQTSLDVTVTANKMNNVCQCPENPHLLDTPVCYYSSTNSNDHERTSLFMEIIFEPWPEQVQWLSYSWSACKLSGGATCGEGTQTRDVVCMGTFAHVTGQIATGDSRCAQSTAKPAESQSCRIACDNDDDDEEAVYVATDGCKCVETFVENRFYPDSCVLGTGRPWCYVGQDSDSAVSCQGAHESSSGTASGTTLRWAYCVPTVPVGLPAINGCDCKETWYSTDGRQCGSSTGGCCNFDQAGNLQEPVCQTTSTAGCQEMELCVPPKYVPTQAGWCEDMNCQPIQDPNTCWNAVTNLLGDQSLLIYSDNSAQSPSGCYIDYSMGVPKWNQASSNAEASLNKWTMCECSSREHETFSWEEGDLTPCEGPCGGTGVQYTTSFCRARSFFNGLDPKVDDGFCQESNRPEVRSESCIPTAPNCDLPAWKSRWRYRAKRSGSSTWSVGEFRIYSDAMCTNDITTSAQDIVLSYEDGASQSIDHKLLLDGDVTTKVSIISDHSSVYLEFRFANAVDIRCVHLFDATYTYEDVSTMKSTLTAQYWDSSFWTNFDAYEFIPTWRWVFLNPNWGRDTNLPVETGVQTDQGCFCQPDWFTTTGDVCGGDTMGCCNYDSNTLGPHCPAVAEGSCSSANDVQLRCDPPGFKMIEGATCADYGCREISKDFCQAVAENTFGLPVRAFITDGREFPGSHCMWHSRLSGLGWAGETIRPAYEGCEGDECHDWHKLCVCSDVRYEYRTADWGACTASCGGGWQSREASCYAIDDALGTATLAPAGKCSGLPLPSLTQVCNTQNCYLQHNMAQCVSAGVEFLFDQSWKEHSPNYGQTDTNNECRFFPASVPAETVPGECSTLCDHVPNCVGFTFTETTKYVNWGFVQMATTESRCCFRSAVQSLEGPIYGSSCHMKPGTSVRTDSGDVCQCQSGWTDKDSRQNCPPEAGGCCDFGEGFACPPVGVTSISDSCNDGLTKVSCDPPGMMTVDWSSETCEEHECEEVYEEDCEEFANFYGLNYAHNIQTQTTGCKIQISGASNERLCRCDIQHTGFNYWEAKPWPESTASDYNCIDNPSECGVGYQERDVYCIQQFTNGTIGGIVDASNCDADAKPEETQTCTLPNQQCVEEDTLVEASWSIDASFTDTFATEAEQENFKETVRAEFAAKMGIPVENVIITALRSGSIIIDFQVVPVANANTVALVQELETQLADPTVWDDSLSSHVQNTMSFSKAVYGYIVNDWSECSAVCGGGTRTRDVVCQKQEDADSTWQIVDIGQCDQDTLPLSEQTCNTQDCLDCAVFDAGDAYSAVDAEDNFRHQDEVVVLCSSGYTASDDEVAETITCFNGEYSNLGLSCGKDCPTTIPGFDNDKHIFVDQQIISSSHGSIVTISCRGPYTSGDSSGVSITCDNGAWTSWQLMCDKNCDEYLVQEEHGINSNGVVIYGIKTPTSHGDEITLRCDEGMGAFREVDTGLTSVTSLRMQCFDGMFVPSDGAGGDFACFNTCSLYGIENQDSEPAATGSVDHLWSGKFSCKNGYSAKDLGAAQSELKCENGNLVGDQLECVRQCNYEPSVAQLISYSVIGEGENDGSSREVRCAPGYSVRYSQLSDEPKVADIYCLDGIWDEVPFSCYEVCDKPYDTERGVETSVAISTTNPMAHGQTFRLRCEDGFRDSDNPRDDVEVECINGEYTDPKGYRVCKAECAYLAIGSEFEYVYYRSTGDEGQSPWHGDYADVTCASGWVPADGFIGEQTIWCSDGYWTQLRLECERAVWWQDWFVERPYIGYSAAGGAAFLFVLFIYCCCRKRKKWKEERRKSRPTGVVSAEVVSGQFISGGKSGSFVEETKPTALPEEVEVAFESPHAPNAAGSSTGPDDLAGKRYSAASSGARSSTENPFAIAAEYESRRNSEKQSTIDNDKKCVICLDQDSSHAIIPCGHKCICQDCLGKMIERTECPVCRGPVEHVARIF